MATQVRPLSLMDLPNEIQYNIIRFCLSGWTAELESHSKPRNDNPEQVKTTTRIWSSRIYDALMLSLTCKGFHFIIQTIQKDPSLFDGRIDLIKKPGSILSLSDFLKKWSEKYDWCLREIMNRTKVFIKDARYGAGTKLERYHARQKYHAGARDWLNNNLHDLRVMDDEFDFSLFPQACPQLRNLTIYISDGHEWRFNNQVSPYDCKVNQPLPMCAESHDEAWFFRHIATNNLSDVEDPELDKLIEQGLSITYLWDIEHHHCGATDWPAERRRCGAHMRVEWVRDKKGIRIKSLHCLQDYARPGQDIEMRKIELSKAVAQDTVDQ